MIKEGKERVGKLIGGLGPSGETYEECGLPLEIPLARVDHVRFDDTTDDISHVVSTTTEHDGLCSKLSRTNLFRKLAFEGL